MRGEQRGEIAAITAEQHRGAANSWFAKGRARRSSVEILMPNAPSSAEPVDDVLRNFARAIDFVRVHLLAQKRFELVAEKRRPDRGPSALCTGKG